MVRPFKSIALAGIVLAGMCWMAAEPALAYDFNLNPLGLDLDPFRILTPAPPSPPVFVPAPEPLKRPHHHHRRMMHHKSM